MPTGRCAARLRVGHALDHDDGDRRHADRGADPGSARRRATDPLFWGSLAVALARRRSAAYPVNRRLIAPRQGPRRSGTDAREAVPCVHPCRVSSFLGARGHGSGMPRLSRRRAHRWRGRSHRGRPDGGFLRRARPARARAAAEKTTGTFRFDLITGSRAEHWFVDVKKGDVTVSRQQRRGRLRRARRQELFDALVAGEANAIAAILRGACRDRRRPRSARVLFQRLFPGPPARHARRAAAGYEREKRMSDGWSRSSTATRSSSATRAATSRPRRPTRPVCSRSTRASCRSGC